MFISLTPAVNDRSGRLALRLILRQTSSHTVSRQPRMHGVSAGRACLLDVRDNDAVVYVIYYSAPDRRVQSTVMSESVSLSLSLSLSLYVCLSAIISSELRVRSSPIFVHVTYGRGSVLLWRRSDDVIFAHKPRLLDVAAQLKRSAHAVLGLAINCAQYYQLQANGCTVTVRFRYGGRCPGQERMNFYIRGFEIRQKSSKYSNF